MKKRLLYTCLIILPVLLSAQEYLTGVGGNGVIRAYMKNHLEQASYKSGFFEIKPLMLPFYDDFSDITIYPDTSRWIDNEAYINADFPYYPPDYGVATLDVIDAKGNVYPEASPFTFMADRMTSKPIRLDEVFDTATQQMHELTPADSVFFSFYYQPQGRGDYPLAQDSLILQFGHYNTDTVFDHFDSVLVHGYDYPVMDTVGPFPPNTIIHPPEGCNQNISYVLKDTLFKDDSLMIPCDSVFTYGREWQTVWSAEGDSMDVFINDNHAFFKYVQIAITDTNFFRSDFQFRFVNFGSISNINSWQSNTDQWNIDMVSLNYGRDSSDRYMNRIAFVENPPGFVSDYTSMPYGQYVSDLDGFKKDSIGIYFHNLDSVEHTVSYRYYVQSSGGDTLNDFTNDWITNNLVPIDSEDVFDYQPWAYPYIKYAFGSLSEDTADFYISHVVREPSEPMVGDTIVYHQEFRNYFSYDDGTAEAGYGLTPSGAQLAVRFRLPNADTLRGVKLYFNKTLSESNNRLFHIKAWGDNNGIPGNVIFDKENVRPRFTTGLNRFYTFVVDTLVKLPAGAFFIGWEQTTNDNLNIGFDRNTDSQNNNFYNVDGTWRKSSFEGSIMMRPILGKPLPGEGQQTKSTFAEDLKIWPNPPQGDKMVYVDLPSEAADPAIRYYLKLSVVDMFGRTVLSGPYVERFSAASLDAGIYLVYLFDAAHEKRYSTKLVIVK